MVLIVSVVVAYGVLMAYTNSKCLEYSYKEARVSYDFSLYCIREENEYEIVKPLREIGSEYEQKN